MNYLRLNRKGNKMTVGELKELLSKYSDDDQVILCTGFYTERGGVDWVETKKYTVYPGNENEAVVYIEGEEPN